MNSKATKFIFQMLMAAVVTIIIVSVIKGFS
ncbi:hypothetical protein PATA110616_06525 [Paenibacillus tarimensis]